MRANKGFPQKRPAFAGAIHTDLRERETDTKQMKLVPTTGLAMVHVCVRAAHAPVSLTGESLGLLLSHRVPPVHRCAAAQPRRTSGQNWIS
jgi:hypothetical protein